MKLDPDNPAPLYYQIAAEIRRRIETGELQPGDALAPMRDAAEEWGVHFHTVRHAYAALVRDGLVETRRGPRGTRVAAGPTPTPSPVETPAGLERYLRGVVDEVRRRWSLERDDLVAALERLQPDRSRPVVWVVECSEHQCALHAEEIGERWDVDARPWPLDNEELPPEGAIVATYFHYNDIRRRWPQRLADIYFVTIQPHPDALTVPDGVDSVVVFETDQETADAVAADVSRVLTRPDIRIETRVATATADVPALEDDVLFFSPRIWADLPAHVRDDRRAYEVRYVFDHTELRRLAERLGWRARARARAMEVPS